VPARAILWLRRDLRLADNPALRLALDRNECPIPLYIYAPDEAADLAANTLGWQWSAGCGADAAPYFRVFNPVRQGERFDLDGAYVRHWCPELAALPDRWVHRPWAAPEPVLRAAGVRLGRDYPVPVVDLAESRREALAAWKRIGGR
jgi:deoxyribodipyrimidine photo-lyase